MKSVVTKGIAVLIKTKFSISVPALPLPALRLMVPPLRLVSAAIWQTIQQRHVLDYGMLEEFVTMVTDVVPELLNDSQRAQLILGLRARVRGRDGTSAHATDAEVGLSESNFLGLVQTLLKDPDEREHFFQDVFPVEFGPSYDAAIQKLMWQFLSRLEKLLPVSNFQQVLFHSSSSLPFIDTLSSSDGDCILSALCLPPVERVVIATEQTDSETHVSSLNVFMDTFTKELEVDSETLAEYTEMEPGTSMDVVEEERVECKRKEKASSVINDEEEDNSEFAETEEVEPVYETVMVLGEDGKMKLSPEGEDTEPFSGVLEATLEDSDSSSNSTPQDPSYDPELSQIKRPKCSRTAKKSNRKTFQKPKHMCRICGKYVTAGAFEYHMRTHSGERPFSCPHPQCGMKFIHSGGLRVHLRRYCKVRTVDAAELDSFNIRFECDKCEKTFTIQSKLRKHKLIHGPLYCTGCRKVLPDLETLTRHKLWHRPVQCSMCEESFMLTNLRTHYLDVHKFSGPFVCTHCPKSYKKFHSLIKHEMVHTGNLPLQCSQCPKRFIYNYDLVEHEKRHSDDRPCLCWECGKAFCTNIDLKQHMLSNSRANHEKTKHGGVRYPCTYCGKQFVCANALKRHDLIHTGERPFKCNHKSCDKAFRSRAELRIHMRYHTGERPFKCNVCGKGFVQANYLTTHYRTHTGEKPYSCSLCDKSFNYHDSLKRHMSTHSNEKPYKCLDCGKAFERKTLLNVHKRSCTSLLKC
uniref:C2H2-type domain-containing protein n=1 Tax=Hucho hucho TaxID=62062 RepID=A0A4W5QQ87_9TELE